MFDSEKQAKEMVAMTLPLIEAILVKQWKAAIEEFKFAHNAKASKPATRGNKQ